MLDALAFGPDFALRYLRASRVCPPTDWTCPSWSDGGAVIDLDRHRLLFFGDELLCDMPIRRAMLAVLNAMWSDFSVGWAYGGTHELASYVGVERKWDDPLRGPDMKLARGRSGPCHVVSVLSNDGCLRLWPLWWGTSSARHGGMVSPLAPGLQVSADAVSGSPLQPSPVTKRLIDIDDELLAAARREVDTTGIADTVRCALRLAATRSARMRQADWLAGATVLDFDQLWVVAAGSC
jgi:Arc/MetJ family transcription regulator